MNDLIFPAAKIPISPEIKTNVFYNLTFWT